LLLLSVKRFHNAGSFPIKRISISMPRKPPSAKATTHASSDLSLLWGGTIGMQAALLERSNTEAPSRP